MCAVGSVVLNGISLSVTSWAVGTNTEGLSNVGMGLFKFCEDRCQTYVDNSFMGDSTDLALVTRTRAASAMVVLSMLVTLIACTFLFFGLGRKPEPNPDFVEGGESDKFIYFWPVVRRAAFWQGVSGFLGLVAVCIFADIIVNLDNDFRFDRFDFGIGDGFVAVAMAVGSKATTTTTTTTLLPPIHTWESLRQTNREVAAASYNTSENTVYVQDATAGPPPGCCNTGMQ
eukprot:gene9166-26034_t